MKQEGDVGEGFLVKATKHLSKDLAPVVVLGTKNKDKVAELKKLLKGSDILVQSLLDFSKCSDVVENGRTFEANARKKSRHYSKHTRRLTLADDSGLLVYFLNGKPGVYSARFAGPGCSYQDNNQKLLRLLDGVPQEKRRAKFVCSIALYNSGKFVRVVKGECWGHIALSEKGKNGFGYDPVFIPLGENQTFAQMSAAKKNKISHRGKALRAVTSEIMRVLLNPASKEASQ